MKGREHGTVFILAFVLFLLPGIAIWIKHGIGATVWWWTGWLVLLVLCYFRPEGRIYGE